MNDLPHRIGAVGDAWRLVLESGAAQAEVDAMVRAGASILKAAPMS